MNWYRFAHVSIVVFAFLSAFGVSVYLDVTYFHDPIMAGGGACDTVGDVKSCYGYPPTGMVVLMFVFAFALYPIHRLIDRLDPHTE